jgi:hypothetical protein
MQKFNNLREKYDQCLSSFKDNDSKKSYGMTLKS